MAESMGKEVKREVEKAIGNVNVKKENIEYSKFNLDKIKKNPYPFICNYVESIYPHVGKKTFQILSLLPVSLILPDIPYGNKSIRSNLNALFLGSSGSGKSSIAKLFSSFVLNPLEFESITSAGLESAIAHSPIFTLVVGDFARMSRDPVLIKVIEGILGEEKSIKRRTARKDVDMDVNGISLLCGVSTDLSKYILTGIIWRVCPILVGHSEKEHSEIGKHIIENSGRHSSNGDEEIIREYYNSLIKIQSDKENKLRVSEFNIPEDFKEMLYSEWNSLTKPYVKEMGFNFFRELMDGLRFMVSHSFLNVYNRKVEKGVLFVEEEDYKIALKLMKKSITFKFRLLRSESFSKGLKDAKDFKKIMESDKVPEQVKEILRNLVDIKGGKVVKKNG